MTSGILNEFPRHRGGSTLRLMRFAAGRLRIVDLPGTVAWVPWWLPATNELGVSLVTTVYREGLADPRSSPAERAVFDRALAEFDYQRAAADVTLGEAQARAMEVIGREVLPDLPVIELVSLTRSPLRHVLRAALEVTPGGMRAVLAAWAAAEDASVWPLAAVATIEDWPHRIRFHATDQTFDAERLLPRRAPTGPRIRAVSEETLLELLDAGDLLPSARLVALAEVALHARGQEVRHFGNTYDYPEAVGSILGIDDTGAIPFCADDQDSWPYAEIVLHEGATSTYPLHLLDVARMSAEAREANITLVSESLARGGPVLLQPRRDLSETVLSRGT